MEVQEDLGQEHDVKIAQTHRDVMFFLAQKLNRLDICWASLEVFGK